MYLAKERTSLLSPKTQKNDNDKAIRKIINKGAQYIALFNQNISDRRGRLLNRRIPQ